MRPINDTLPTYQVAAVLREYIKATNFTVSAIDNLAGYRAEGVTRHILSEIYAVTSMETAERLLEVVGGALWEIPDYQMVGKAKRSIRLRMVKCACGCRQRTLSHYVNVLANGKHQWKKKVGLDPRQTHFHDRVFIHGHKSKLPEMRERYRETTAAAWTPERRARHSALVSSQWTDQRKVDHARKLKEAAARRRQEKMSMTRIPA